MNDRYIIVGRGITIQLMNEILLNKTKNWIAIEQNESESHVLFSELNRLYERPSFEFLTKHLPDLVQKTNHEESYKYRKGEWLPIEGVENSEIKPRFKNDFYSINLPNNANIKLPYSNQVVSTKRITEIDPSNKTVSCFEGNTYAYEKIIWCDEMKGLLNCCDELAHLKWVSEMGKENSCISYIQYLDTPWLPQFPSLIFPFRFKQLELQAVGINQIRGVESTIAWIILIDEEWREDHEEVAKCIRVFKRELTRAFPELFKKSIREHLLFQERATFFEPTLIPSFEVIPNLYFMGSEVTLFGSASGLSYLDSFIQNCNDFEKNYINSL